MDNNHSAIQLNARIFLMGKIHLLSGLHIGGSQGGIDIGGVDLTIVRNPFNREPYVPGSSIKGKLRSLLEKAYGLKQTQSLGGVHIHRCKDAKAYEVCEVCPIFGVPAETQLEIPETKMQLATPTRLVARDAHLTDESRTRLKELKLDTEFAEIKTEVVIDRITSQAMPRSQERVPAGVEFDFELVFSLYDKENGKRLEKLVEAMQLLEGDFLGGQGSRGSGKVKFVDLKVFVSTTKPYQPPNGVASLEYDDFSRLAADGEWLKKIQNRLSAASA